MMAPSQVKKKSGIVSMDFFCSTTYLSFSHYQYLLFFYFFFLDPLYLSSSLLRVFLATQDVGGGLLN